MIPSKRKASIIKSYQQSAADTGSASVQVALLTERIRELTEHLKTHKKDLSSRMGLVKLVSARRRMLNYVKKTDEDTYNKLIAKLELRK